VPSRIVSSQAAVFAVFNVSEKIGRENRTLKLLVKNCGRPKESPKIVCQGRPIFFSSIIELAIQREKQMWAHPSVTNGGPRLYPVVYGPMFCCRDRSPAVVPE
jgi:hypothetical protein